MSLMAAQNAKVIFWLVILAMKETTSSNKVAEGVKCASFACSRFMGCFHMEKPTSKETDMWHMYDSIFLIQSWTLFLILPLWVVRSWFTKKKEDVGEREKKGLGGRERGKWGQTEEQRKTEREIHRQKDRQSYHLLLKPCQRQEMKKRVIKRWNLVAKTLQSACLLNIHFHKVSCLVKLQHKSH